MSTEKANKAPKIYLLFTILLAFNLSAEIAQSFSTLVTSLKISAIQLESKNNQLADEIYQILDEQTAEPNSRNHTLRPILDELTQQTDITINTLDYYIKCIESESIAGYDSVKKELKMPEEIRKNYRFWIGNEQGGEAQKLKTKLNGFVKFANESRKKMTRKGQSKTKLYKDLCINPQNDPFIPRNSPIKNKLWEEATFHGATAISNIALLQKFKTDIRVIESDLLAELKEQVKVTPIYSINKLRPIVVPESNRVLARRSFKAKIYLAMSLGAGDKAPRFSGEGVSVDSMDRAVGEITIETHSKLMMGEVQKSQQYSASVAIPQSNGGYKLDTVKGNFVIVRPEKMMTIVNQMVQTGHCRQSLYRECRNEIEFLDYQLGSEYHHNPDFEQNFKFESENCEIWQHPKMKNRLAITPRSTRANLKIFNTFNGASKIEIASKEFNVLVPPPPNMIVTINQKEPFWNNREINKNDSVQIRAEADAYFYDILPKDSRYQIKSIRVSVRLKDRTGPYEVIDTIGESEIGHKAKIEIKLEKYKLKSGDKIRLELGPVCRYNFQNKKIDEYSNVHHLDKLYQFIVE